MITTPPTDPPVQRRVRAWWLDAVLFGFATLLAELALHESVVRSPAPIPEELRGFIDAVGLVLIVSPLFAWTLYRRAVDAKYERLHLTQRKAPGSPHHRVRVAILSSLGIFAVIVAGLLWGNVAAARTLARQGELIDLLGQMRLHGERIERLAGTAATDVIDAALLTDELNRLDADAVRLRQMMARVDYRSVRSEAGLDSVVTLLAPLQQELLHTTQRLQGDSAGLFHGLAQDARQQAIMHQTLTAQALGSVQQVQKRDIQYTQHAAWSGAALAFAALLGIAVLVVEPVVRLLRRQHVAITTKSQEFERLAMVAQRTSNAVVITDAERRITWANEGFTRLTGWELSEVLGRKPGDVLQNGVADPAVVAAMRAALDAEQSVRTVVLNVKKSGERYWNELNIEPLREHGVLTGYIAVQSDVSEQVNAREALRREREMLARTKQQLEEAQTLARIGNWELDITTNAIEWSPGTFLLFGREPDEGNPSVHDALGGYDAEELPRLQDAIERSKRTGEAYSLVLRTAGRNPMVRWVRADGRVRRGPDRTIIGLYGTATDVTESIEREAALRLAQERAEAASRSKSEFLANMSHEIRTPLTAILGYTDLLRDEAANEGATTEQLQAMDTIRRAGEHLLTVINDILDLSKIEAGKLEVEQVDTALPSVLLDVESLMRARAQAKGVSLESRILTPVPDRIVTDPTRLRQILMNLVGNAAKFTERGRILVETSVESERGGDLLVIAVDDTGPGMSEEQALSLFQPFTQADSSVTRRHGGTGLGLAICRRLAELMGGHVELVTTAPGRGSRFELRLPLQAADDARHIHRLDPATDGPVPTVPPTRALQGRRILLAEDGEDNQRLITVLLRAAGAEVTVVANGRQAIDALSWAEAGGAAFDLLLTDMQMPEMDGYTLASTLRAAGSRMPIVALTAHAMADDRRKCLDAGCDDYATKPIDRHALIATCAQWLASDELFPAAGEGDLLGVSVPLEAEDGLEAPPQTLVSELLDDPDVAGLVIGFAEALPARVAAIAGLASAGDVFEALRLVHQLKGAAGSYGYPALSELARQLEQHWTATERTDGDRADRLLARLTAFAEAARRAVAPIAMGGGA